jgi:hypothetical protein
MWCVWYLQSTNKPSHVDLGWALRFISWRAVGFYHPRGMYCAGHIRLGCWRLWTAVLGHRSRLPKKFRRWLKIGFSLCKDSITTSCFAVWTYYSGLFARKVCASNQSWCSFRGSSPTTSLWQPRLTTFHFLTAPRWIAKWGRQRKHIYNYYAEENVS